ncbi:MAG: hypothetical protein JSS58_02085 [Proteobacteria bacterium]|nr:hypothetical protein [Pseudomonadota bacterium]
MKTSFKPNWFDLFMLFGATISLALWIYGREISLIIAPQEPGIFFVTLTLFAYFCATGFLPATLLYFGWRFKGNGN